MQCTPLFDEYTVHGAKVVDFHGWGLPVQFSGIIQEHLHTRGHAGLFDCSHMGEFLLQGTAAIQAFDSLVFGDMIGLKAGRCRYTAILNGHGGIIDDCVGLKLSEDILYLVTNAGPLEQVAALIQKTCPDTENLSEATAKLDIQGPHSREVLLALGLDPVAGLGYWTGARTSWRGKQIVVTRAGYTGELGYELFTPNEVAVDLWRAAVAHPEVIPCGLGARDTLRTEVGYPLNGDDMSEAKTPLEAGMERFVCWDKEFNGKKRLLEQKECGGYAVLTAIKSNNRQAPRHGFEVKHNGEVVGEVTSGTFGPSVGCGVGLAYLPPVLSAPGTPLTAGPRDLAIEAAEIPVYKGGTCRIKIP
ncbi:MAG TPA: glycine cleavage system aminomethyltransferase GcvT [Candidatus Hydrogenedentes bacterium]|nr:glycine cleavage system aminomethyltransferase GcvT [Candidatus Hydrogenedentota bacterium]